MYQPLFDETAIFSQGHGSGGKEDVRLHGKGPSVLLLGASGILEPALLYAFDGSRKCWSEEDEPIPIRTYGRQKLEAERHLAALRK